MKFLLEFNFAYGQFFALREKMSRISISDFTTGTNFRGFLARFCLVFDVRKIYRARVVVLSCLFYYSSKLRKGMISYAMAVIKFTQRMQRLFDMLQLQREKS